MPLFTTYALLGLILPLWLAMGVGDWLLHRRDRIEDTAGWRESMLHLLLLMQCGVPLLLGLFFEINSAVLLVVLGGFLMHEATRLWDLNFANCRRDISVPEQWVHDYLGVLPLFCVILTAGLAPESLYALLAFQWAEDAFVFRLRECQLNIAYLLVMVARGAGLLALYLEELWRSLKARKNAHLMRL